MSDIWLGNHELIVIEIEDDSVVIEVENEILQVLPGGITGPRGPQGPQGEAADVTQIEADIDSLEDGLADEIAARIAADIVLQDHIDDEAGLRDAGDDTLLVAIQDETAARIAADAALQSQIDGVDTDVSDLASDLATEVAARIADVNAEESARISDVNAEESARIAADDVLTDALAAEVITRGAADDALSDDIVAEAGIRAAADTALSGDILDEENARIAGDDALTSALAAEVITRGDADDALQDNINDTNTNLDNTFTIALGAANDIAAHIADGTDAHDASAISVLDTAGNFTATEVEGALAELADSITGDAGAVADDLADHIAETTTAHGGIVADDDARLTDNRDPNDHNTTHFTAGTDPITPADIGAATSVDLDNTFGIALGAANDIAAHIADTSDAHDASAISIVDSGTQYTATDVEGALAEVKTIADDAATATDLGTHEALTTAAHGGIVADDDPRLTDDRDPTAHNTTHYANGADPVYLEMTQAAYDLITPVAGLLYVIVG